MDLLGKRGLVGSNEDANLQNKKKRESPNNEKYEEKDVTAGIESKEEVSKRRKIRYEEKDEQRNSDKNHVTDEEENKLKQKELEELKKRMEEISETIVETRQELADMKKTNEELEKKVERLEKCLDKERRSNKREIELLKDKLGNLKRSEGSTEEMDRKEDQISEGTNEISEEEQICEGENEITEEDIERRYWRKVPEPLSKIEYEWEMKERSVRKKNVYVRGLRGNNVEEELKRLVKEKIGIRLYIRKTRPVGGGVLVTLESMKHKIELMKNKARLDEINVWVEDDYTKRERNVQQWIREIAEEERRNGQDAKAGYLKLRVNGTWYQWDDMAGTLTDQTFEEETLE